MNQQSEYENYNTGVDEHLDYENISGKCENAETKCDKLAIFVIVS